MIMRLNLFRSIVVVLVLNSVITLEFSLTENNLPVQFLPSPEYPSLHAQV